FSVCLAIKKYPQVWPSNTSTRNTMNLYYFYLITKCAQLPPRAAVGRNRIINPVAAAFLPALWLCCQLPNLSAQSLGDALDAPQLTWTTGGSAGWVVETYRTHDGVAAAQSGSIEYYQQASWIQTTVTDPGTLTF